jgi:hypothetical protein
MKTSCHFNTLLLLALLASVSLCGPMVIVDQASGTRATSQPEQEGQPPRFPGFAEV